VVLSVLYHFHWLSCVRWLWPIKVRAIALLL